MVSYSAPDLTQHPPRSPRVRLGGFVHLPRLLDKARAASLPGGKLGDFVFPCPLDKRFLDFTGVNPDALLAQAREGKTDAEILAFINANTKPNRSAWEIEAWSRWLESMSPGDSQLHTRFADNIKELAPERDDIRTILDMLDLDDYVTFGGKG